ncbi:DUF4189 domain-containing protein [Roseomonas stagni]|uniref:DUF4189 domain-containing protein n=1 Tax=Falsiroseomonas algicola TaxID=2716930 RepID=A0A6M1LTN0_9PROT|nr:DUF4189 domain-containing protein [Falsiroseomonas algicola]NGM22944.1 DUF4189 domain-containing protein [Falsiroseomonas algicola]
MRIASLAAALCLMALPALASQQSSRTPGPHRDTAALCRAECLATAASRPGGAAANAPQACAVRCDAAVSYLRSQQAPGTAEATGRGAVMQPVAIARPARPAATHGVIYGARTPSAAFGMVVGEADRLAAHRSAERACTTAGPGCRVLAEFTEACGAVAQGYKRSQWALFISSDPNSYVITSLSAGAGPRQDQAERQALAECRSRDPQANCRVVAAACAGQRG